MNHIQKRFKQSLQPAREKLDQKALEILDDLIEKLPSLKSMMIIPDEDKLFTSCVGFQGDECSIVVADYDGALNEFAMEGNMKLVKKNQFASFAENRMYCEGAGGCLLELLIRYGYIETEKAVIASTPDVCVWRNDKASLKPEDLLNSYDKDRAVVTTIVFDSGFIAFTFQKSIKLKARGK